MAVLIAVANFEGCVLGAVLPVRVPKHKATKFITLCALASILIDCEQPEKYCNRKSEITTTTRGLSQSSLYDPLQDIKKRYSLGEHAKSLDKISSDLEQSLSNHHSYHTAKATPSRTSLHSSDEEYESLIQNSYTSLDEPVSGRPVPREARSWYTDPLHLSGICLKDSGGSRRILYPPDRATGTLGARLAAEKLAKSRVISRHEMELLSKQLSLRDTLALTYFPLTLGSKFSIEELDGTEDDALMLSPRPKISSKPDEAQNLIMGKPMTRPRSTGKFHRRHDDTDELYLLTQEAPQTASAAGINFTSPYIEDLAQLRMERLRIEEDRLLEKKRVAELERIRGPRTRWYESRGPDFHYEAHKNTEQIKNEKSWNDLLTYREDLAKSSLDCSKLYNKSLVF